MTPEQAFIEAAGPGVELIKFERYTTADGKRALDFVFKRGGEKRRRSVGGLDYDNEVTEASVCGHAARTWGSGEHA